MKVDKEYRRLKAIKLKYVLFPTKCKCCGEEYTREKMWQVYRWGVNETWNEWHYCQDCMHSAEEVLHEIDTDECDFGIAGVDGFWDRDFKKDCTRMNLKRDKIFKAWGPLGARGIDAQ